MIVYMGLEYQVEDDKASILLLKIDVKQFKI